MMNSPIKKEIVAHFSGISTSSFKGYRIMVDLFVDELLIKAPDHNSGISYKFDSFSQLIIEHRQEAKPEDILDITIVYSGRRSETESIIIQREDIEQILKRYRYFQGKLAKPLRNDFDQVQEMKTVALVEFNNKHDVRNYNYGSLLLSNREINFMSYSGKNFILHLDQLYDSFYYEAVALPNDILGYSRWVSILKVSEQKKSSSEIVTFLTDELQAQFIEQLLSKHYEKYINQKFNKMQERWMSFNKCVDGYYSMLSGDQEMLGLVSSFIDKYGEQVLLNPDTYLKFEQLLRNICYQSQIALSFGNAIEIEIDQEVFDFFENEFLNLVKSFMGKYSFENRDVAVFTVWKLVKHVAFEDYNNSFAQQNAGYFEKSENLDDFLAVYMNIKNGDVNSANNIALFTYYLMKNYWKNEDNFNYYYHTLEQEIIRNKEKYIMEEGKLVDKDQP
ncbi:MAG: hypothetical protein PHX14_06265 [Syntrophomonadaceae bacterium]|nr:hypothetical protein [Syntrophomonadaceae bacterium]